MAVARLFQTSGQCDIPAVKHRLHRQRFNYAVIGNSILYPQPIIVLCESRSPPHSINTLSRSAYWSRNRRLTSLNTRLQAFSCFEDTRQYFSKNESERKYHSHADHSRPILHRKTHKGMPPTYQCNTQHCAHIQWCASYIYYMTSEVEAYKTYFRICQSYWSRLHNRFQLQNVGPCHAQKRIFDDIRWSL